MAILFSILLIIIWIYFVANALNNFFMYKKSVAPSLDLTVDRFHFFLKNEINKEWIQLTSPKPTNDYESALKTFRISIKKEDLNTLNINLPESGKDHYIDAMLKVSDDTKIKKVKLRYRGDNNFHWLYTQKSLRIKFSDKDTYNMEKKLNLINPPLKYSILDILNYKYASELNLISPNYFPVRVFINGNYMGVYMYLSQIDESLLRKHKRMPGSIYSGDSAKREVSGKWKLWEDPSLWIKKSSRNAEQKYIREDINFFIQQSNSNNKDFYYFFNHFLDKDKFYNYFAIDTIFGTHHHDEHHNHKLYFDPYKGKFEPIEWDIRFWFKEKYKDMSIYKLIEQVKLNPILEYQRDKVSYNLLKSSKFQVNTIFNNLKNIQKLIQQDLLSDTNKDTAVIHKLFPTWISKPFTMKEFNTSIFSFKNILEERHKFLLDTYNDTSIKYMQINNKLIFEVSGNSPVTLNFKKLFPNQKIYKDINFNSHLDNKDTEVINNEILYPGRKIISNLPYAWPNALKRIKNAPLYYTYFISDVPSFNQILLKNAITGKPIIANTEPFTPSYTSDSIHPWKLPQLKKKIKNFSGTIEIKKSLEFTKDTTVNIAPGTIFIMDANTSIYFYGKVEALGTKDKPIKFIAKDSTKPWGLIAIQGKATTGSKFEYVEFTNGSIDTHNMIHYTSPFNIHDMDWFEVRHCKIGKNFIGDDAMHIAYAKGIVDSCEFTNARSDGLDIDISDVSITNNIFYNSGNDGLDIMTTTMDASNNVFIDMGDKGISVGEWSEANITDSFFLRTVIGTEIKDKSVVHGNNLIYINSKEKAINLYNKNKRYDSGGFLYAGKLYLVGNNKIQNDKFSKTNIISIEYKVPNFKSLQWYQNLIGTPYIKLISQIEGADLNE
jgi:hypothetical protein